MQSFQARVRGQNLEEALVSLKDREEHDFSS